MTLYKHVISLGWFCSVAEEIEKLGLRSASYPFDWILTDGKTVEEIMKGEFADYLKSDKLIQDAEVPNMYHHSGRKCLVYVHDIDPYENYENQIEKAQMKYARRLTRLRHDICEPCIFLRYIQDEEEYRYIVKKHDEISSWLQGFNPENQIVYIANKELGQSDFIWSVEKDNQDTVARNFLDQLPGLKKWLLSQQYDFLIESNLKWYRRKIIRKKWHRFFEKVRHGIRRLERQLKKQMQNGGKQK